MKTLILDIEKLRSDIEANPQEWECKTILKNQGTFLDFSGFIMPLPHYLAQLNNELIYTYISLCDKNPLDYFKEQQNLYTFDEAMAYIDEKWSVKKNNNFRFYHEQSNSRITVYQDSFEFLLNGIAVTQSKIKHITDFVLVEGKMKLMKKFMTIPQLENDWVKTMFMQKDDNSNKFEVFTPTGAGEEANNDNPCKCCRDFGNLPKPTEFRCLACGNKKGGV